MAKKHRRPNKKTPNEDLIVEWGKDITRRDIEEEIAADRRQREENTWPVNDYVLGAALILIGVIVLIAVALATGLVKS